MGGAFKVKTPRLRGFVLLMVLLATTGCVTAASVATAKDEGLSRVYRISSKQAWKIAKMVFRWEGKDLIEEHRTEGVLVARNGEKWQPWGSMQAAWVERVDRRHTRITVVSKGNIGVNVKKTSSEARFHVRFGQALKIVRAGRSLPVEPPK